MADITIQIPVPTLTAGQYFKVRYRLLPSGSWSGYMTKSNLAFTITGLSEGEYQMEFILVNADATECAAVYRTYTVVTDYECINFNSQMVKVVDLYHIEVTYTLPVGFTNPACGWEIEWMPLGGSPTKIPYASLPASGIIKIPTPNDGGIFRIHALMCNGRTKQCHVNDIVEILPPACHSMTGLSANIIQELQPNGTYWYYMIINYTQSIPATTSLHLDISQWGQSGFAQKEFRGYVNISPTSSKLKFKLNPTLALQQELMEYFLFVTDICGGTHPRIGVNFYRSDWYGKTP